MSRWTFTSESVTEGHPDKMADQVSDAILDAIMAEDPQGRVACETLLTTGLVVVAGEISTKAYVDIPKIVRETVCGIGYDRESYGFDGNTCGVITAIDEQSPDIAQGVDLAQEVRSGTSGEDILNAQGAGDQGMMFGYACDETDDLMPLPIWLAHRLAQRMAEVRKAGVLPYLRPDGKTQVTVDYENGRPAALKTVLISTQHQPGIDIETLLKPDLRDHVIHPLLPGEFADDKLRDPGQPHRPVRAGWPARRHRPHRPQDHRRHLRRRRPPRRRRLLGQGPEQGRPLGRLRRPLGGQARGRVGRGAPVRDPGGLRHRRRPAGLGDGRDVRHRDRRPGRASRRWCRRSSTCGRPPSSATSTCAGPIYKRTAAYGHFGRSDKEFTWERLNRLDDVKRALEL